MIWMTGPNEAEVDIEQFDSEYQVPSAWGVFQRRCAFARDRKSNFASESRFLVA